MKSYQSPAAAIFTIKATLTVLCLTIFSGLSGQTCMKYVPSNAPVILTMNLKNLDKKVNLDQMKQYTFYQEIIKELTQSGTMNEFESAYFEDFMYAPEKLGYDLLEPIYFFIKKEGDRTYFTLVTKLADRSKYEMGLQKLAQEKYLPNLQQKDGYQLYQEGGDTYAWNDEVVVNVWSEKTADPYAGWGIEEETYEEVEAGEPWVMEETPEYEIEEEPAPELEVEEDISEDLPVFDDVENTGPFEWQDPEDNTPAAEWAGQVLRREFLQPVTFNEKFRAAVQKPSDVHLWLDYEFVMESMGGRSIANMGFTGELQQAMSAIQGFSEIFYADTYLSMGLNFENGKMAIDYDLFFNEEMGDLYRGMFDVKFNKKFLRYVKGGDQLFGYFYLNYNIKKTIEEGKGLMYKLFEATPQYGEAAADAMQILGIFIDEEAIGNLLRGDLLVAVSGLQTVPVKTTTYDYDEDFNITPKDTTILKTLPIFTGMLSYGSEKDIMKFINLGLHSKVLTQEGAYYKFVVPGEGIDIYLAMKKGVLLFTNNRDLIVNRLEKGYARKERLSKKHRKLLCESAAGFYWDIPNTIKAAAGDEPGAGPMAYLEMMGKEFESVEMASSKKVDDRLQSRLDFNFRNKNVNSLQQFFNFVNDVYLEVIGGAKI